jgi:O-antigen/teichoic acid export membrane protein
MSSIRRSMQWNIGASWIVHVASLVIGFFLMPYVIHVLGDSQYGAWVFINCIASYAGLLYLGFGATISRYVAKYSSEQDWQKLNEVTTLVFAVYMVMGAMAFSVAVGLALAVPYLPIWKEYSVLEIQLVALMLGLNVVTGLAGSVFGGVLMGLRRFDLERGISFTCDVARVVLIVVFLQRPWGLLTVATIYWIVTLIENVGYVWLAYRQLPNLSIHRKHLNWAIFSECCEFSGFAFLNAIAQQLIYATDTIVIGVILGEAAVTPYFIALRLCQYLRTPIDKVSAICMPTAGALQSKLQSGALRELLNRGLGLTFTLSAGTLIGAYYFGGALIQTWMGPGYGTTPNVLMILLLGQVVALPVGVVRSILFGLGHVRVPALVYLAEAAVNLVLSLVLAYTMGVEGVAWGTSIPIIAFELGIILPMGLRQLGCSARQVFRESLIPQLLPLAGLWIYSQQIALRFPDHNNWPALIAITAGGGAVIVVIWLLEMLVERWFSSRAASVA